MTAEYWPDVEGGMKTYLLADTDVIAAVGTRVFFAVPASPTFPLVCVRRVGGGEGLGEAPVDEAIIAFDCWGDVKDKASAYTVKAAVRRALFKIRGGPTVLRTPAAGVPGVDAFGASVNGDTWAPDPADDRSRYVVTAAVTAIATAPL